MKRHLITICIVALSFVVANVASAQEQERKKPRLLTPAGMGLSIGGSFSDFVQNDIRDFTTPGGGIEARYVFGTRSYIAGEAAYIGTLNGLEGLGNAVEDNALLMSNGVEGALRVNFLTEEWQPYALAGLGWRHYNVVNTDVNTSDVRDEDDAMTIPVGLGVAYRYQNIFADLRAMYKPSVFDDITISAQDAQLDTASASLNIGFEF
jgi:hypothetical protein